MHYDVLAPLFLYAFIFLFCVFALCRDNFVLLRKNISVERSFNVFLLTLLVGLLSARVVFVIFHFSKSYLNPLVFFLFPYFPGLSASGALLGAAIFLLMFADRSKLPAFHVFDIFSLSSLITLPFGLAIYLFSSGLFLWAIPFALFDYIVAIALASSFLKARLKDGSIGFLGMTVASLTIYFLQLIHKVWFVPEDAVLMLLLGANLFLLFRQETFTIRFHFKPHLKMPKKKKKIKWRQIR